MGHVGIEESVGEAVYVVEVDIGLVVYEDMWMKAGKAVNVGEKTLFDEIATVELLCISEARGGELDVDF